jgi:hypothetical protein
MNSFSKEFFYLLLALPLGIFYFVVIITGLSLGAGLMITWLGIPILIATFAFSNIFTNYERALANNFLDAKISPFIKTERPHGIWVNFKAHFMDGRTWTQAFYLIAKLPLGIITFTIEVTLFMTSLFLIVTPLLYQQSWYQYVGVNFWYITSLPQALGAMCGGIVLTIVFYYVTKGLAVISSEFARSALV